VRGADQQARSSPAAEGERNCARSSKSGHLGKKGGLALRRQGDLRTARPDQGSKLFDVLAATVQGPPGRLHPASIKAASGYGDNARWAVIEFVDAPSCHGPRFGPVQEKPAERP